MNIFGIIEMNCLMGWRGEMSFHTKIIINIFTEQVAWKLKETEVPRKINMKAFGGFFETFTDLQTTRKNVLWLWRITACLVTIQYSQFQLRLKTEKKKSFLQQCMIKRVIISIHLSFISTQTANPGESTYICHCQWTKTIENSH